MWLNRPQRGEGASPQVREGGGGEGGGFFQKHLNFGTHSSSFLGTASVERSSSYI